MSAPDRMDICNTLWVEKHQRLIDTLPKDSVLDLGCGIGQFTEYWLRNGFSVVSADISRVALDELRRRIPNVNTMELDMGKPLPFEDRSFEVVFANQSSIFILRSRKSASKCVKIAAPSSVDSTLSPAIIMSKLNTKCRRRASYGLTAAAFSVSS